MKNPFFIKLTITFKKRKFKKETRKEPFKTLKQIKSYRYRYYTNVQGFFRLFS